MAATKCAACRVSTHEVDTEHEAAETEDEQAEESHFEDELELERKEA